MGDAPGRPAASRPPTARSPPRRSTCSGRPPRTAPSRMRPSGPDAPRCRRAHGRRASGRLPVGPIPSARTRAARSRSRRQVSGPCGRRDGTSSDRPHGDAARRVVVRLAHRHGSAPRRGRPDRPAGRPRPRPQVTHDVPCLWAFRRRARTTSRSSASRLRRPEACPKDRHRTSRARDVAVARTRTIRRPPLPRQRTGNRRCLPAPSATCWPSCRRSSPPGNAAPARTVEPAPTPIPPSTDTA